MNAAEKKKFEERILDPELIKLNEKLGCFGRLLDIDYFETEAHLLDQIKDRVKAGDTAYDIAEYSHHDLRAVASYLKIPGRSSMTRKKEMATAIVKAVGGKKKQWKKCW